MHLPNPRRVRVRILDAISETGYASRMQQAVTIFGYGPQGQAHAQNFRDQGWQVTVAVREGGASHAAAKTDGFAVECDLAAAAVQTEIAYLLVADHAQPELWREALEANLPQGATMCFAHGYNIHYGHITPRADLDVLLMAPMCPGRSVRAHFVNNEATPIITAVHQDASGFAQNSLNLLVSAVTKNRAECIPSSMQEETETNLFAEQALLIGGLSHLILATFDTMVEAGYNPKLAYYWCLYDLRDCAALFAERGMSGALEGISRTARHGGLTRGPRIINDDTRNKLREVLTEVQSGQYATELENTADVPASAWREHLINQLHCSA